MAPKVRWSIVIYDHVLIMDIAGIHCRRSPCLDCIWDTSPLHFVNSNFCPSHPSRWTCETRHLCWGRSLHWPQPASTAGKAPTSTASEAPHHRISCIQTSVCLILPSELAKHAISVELVSALAATSIHCRQSPCLNCVWGTSLSHFVNPTLCPSHPSWWTCETCHLCQVSLCTGCNQHPLQAKSLPQLCPRHLTVAFHESKPLFVSSFSVNLWNMPSLSSQSPRWPQPASTAGKAPASTVSKALQAHHHISWIQTSVHLIFPGELVKHAISVRVGLCAGHSYIVSILVVTPCQLAHHAPLEHSLCWSKIVPSSG